MDTIEERLVKARREARSSMEWFRALRAIQSEYFADDASRHAEWSEKQIKRSMSDWRKVMDRVDEAMKEGPRANWDF